MASTSTELSSSSSSSSPQWKYNVSSSSSPQWKNNVFLSCRGVIKNFADRLYAALDRNGIYCFRDDEKLERGKAMAPELLKAIEESMISIIIISRTYASSKWCLDELVKVVECKKKMGQKVLPVFYDVDPSDVRKQTGSFAEAFSIHEEVFRDNQEKVQKWREAMTEVGNLSGFHLKNRHESEFIKAIVKFISSKLNPTKFSVVEGLVGIDSHLEKLMRLHVRIGLDNVGMIGIYGMGGIGKTTIARVFYECMSRQFEGSSFLANVREVWERRDVIHLQKQLLSQILMETDIKIWDAYDGIDMIRRRLCHKRVLVVIDDVNLLDQLKELARMHDWFGSGSRIIITTRDKSLIVKHGVNELYGVEGLGYSEALHLFSLKAFNNDHPPEDFVKMSSHFVNYASGLPLALKVVGSFLFDKRIREWESALKRLKENAEKEIFNILQLSFDGLMESEKEIFLDVACFFKGKKKDHVMRILDSCGFHAEIGIRVLIDKSLIIMSDDKLWMHDLLQDLGRKIVQQESLREPGERSRLWLYEDVYHVFTKNSGTEKVGAIVLDSLERKEGQLSAKAFSKLKKLRLLILRNVHIFYGFEYLSNELRVVNWHGYPFKCMPSSFQPDELVELKMCYSHIEQLWKGIKCLNKLKIIKLSHSKNLIKTPDFRGVPNLEKLILEGCSKLSKVDQSLGVLERLILLNLKDCKKLVSLPSSITGLKSLKTLSLSGCSKLENIPENLGYVECLEELDVSGTAISQAPSSIFLLKNLNELSFRGCKGPSSKSWQLNLIKTPDFTGFPNLVKLILEGCPTLTKVDQSIGVLERLILLNLKDCKNLVSLPSSIYDLKSLKTLNLAGCSKLENVLENLRYVECLEELNVSGTAIRQLPSTKSWPLKRLKENAEGSWPYNDVYHVLTENTNFLEKTNAKDAFGNIVLGDIGLHVQQEISDLHPHKRSSSDSLNETAEKIHVYVEEMLKNGKVLNKKKDFLLLITSYPMIMVDKDKSWKWIKDVLEIIRAVKLTEKSEPFDSLYRDKVDGLSLRIQERLNDPLMEDVERILPRDMIEIMYEPEPLEVNKLSLVDKEHNKTLLVPQGIFDMAVDFSVHQILENTRSGSIRYIRITGRGEKMVIQALKDHPNVASLFKYVLRVTLSENQSNTEVQKEIAELLGLMSTMWWSELFNKLESSKFLLLLEDCHNKINLVDVDMALQKNAGVVVFTSESSQATIEADMEVRIEDHLLSWKLFCRNVGEVVFSSNIQQIAVRIVQECRGHLLAIILMARSLKNVTDINFWELALHKLSMLPSSQIEGIDKAIINALTFNWEGMENTAKHCIRHCVLYSDGEWIGKRSLISRWIKDHVVYSHDEGNYILRSFTNAYLVEDRLADHVRFPGEIYDVLVNLLLPEMDPVFLKQCDFALSESMKEGEWDAKEIHLMDISELPESPDCPSLIALYLQRNYDLTFIPPLFFEHMPVLQVLDLSYTSIKSLPESLPKLVALRKLVLRGCELLMELSPQVGELKNLEELDLDETQITYLPVEIGKLVKLKRLRVSFYGDKKSSKKRLQSSTVIHTGVISNLSQLTELSIDVNPDDERWNATVEAIEEEVCSSKMLDTLSLYLPKVDLLKKLGMGNTSLIYHPWSRFSFVVGHHKRRIISRVPDEVEECFKEWDKCLKFVNGKGIPDEITEVLGNATAFYLERNATAVNLSEFGIENMKKLKFCLLAECNEMQTIIDDSDSAEEVALGSLRYLGIYYMNNLRSIWEEPIHECSLSNLKILAIHTCPNLSTIFSVGLLANLINLKELTVEDCPQVTCLVSHASSEQPSFNYLPSLRRISLLFLPELISISSGLHIAPKLERIGFYYCPKLENLSTTELSSQNLKVIKGERKWWDEALKWNESEWGSCPDYLNDIFCEIDEEKDVMTQLTEQE